jgi:hypothetical protein
MLCVLHLLNNAAAPHTPASPRTGSLSFDAMVITCILTLAIATYRGQDMEEGLRLEARSTPARHLRPPKRPQGL